MKQDDIYARVTQQIIAAIEKGKQQFRLPWHITEAATYRPTNAVSKRLYRGINLLNLWATAEEHGYASGFWATYRQWQELGAQVREGEKAAEIVFWKPTAGVRNAGASNDGEAEAVTEQICGGLVARDFSVFNAQ